MFLGDSQQDIAEKLSISLTTVGKHRQHIYEKSGTHCEIDALLAGYQCGLFSIVDLFGIET
jgi:DNA-binding NarL/FixJ family response regulator